MPKSLLFLYSRVFQSDRSGSWAFFSFPRAKLLAEFSEVRAKTLKNNIVIRFLSHRENDDEEKKRSGICSLKSSTNSLLSRRIMRHMLRGCLQSIPTPPSADYLAGREKEMLYTHSSLDENKRGSPFPHHNWAQIEAHFLTKDLILTGRVLKENWHGKRIHEIELNYSMIARF